MFNLALHWYGLIDEIPFGTLKNMVIYEVTAKVGSHLADDYEQYMRNQHIPDILRTGLFLSASFAFTGDGLYQVRYQAENRASLDQYLDERADLFRSDFRSRFPSGVELTRREWSLIQTWKC